MRARYVERLCHRAHRPSPGNEVELNSSFLACGPGHGLAEQLILHGLLAKQPMQFANLRLERAILGSWHHFLASRRGGQRTLAHQPAPGEHLAATDAVLAGDER